MSHVSIERPRLATGRTSTVVNGYTKICGGKRIREIDCALYSVSVAIAYVHLRIDGIDRCRRINGRVDINIAVVFLYVDGS